ncbi:MAG: dTDP-4-dehydrorhamnose 3,5-epimerase [Hyphomonadaceae bacterium]|nr:dTDP-4-dehydrorhamnose 3,5-epimerase [Hyphomonadaceae bacterium]
MKITKTNLQDVHLIEMSPHGDNRGWFGRSFCMETFAANKLEISYPHHNTGFSHTKGTLRGMHFQVDPHYEVKVVRALWGAIYDVIVDMRPHSSTYLQWEGYELSFENGRQLYVPRGFAHGYQTLQDNTMVNYLCSSTYVPESNGGYLYNDPAFRIEWPLPVSEISDKDKSWAPFKEVAGRPKPTSMPAR